ncbi:MAG TPA: class I SAM-dependent methyltransferase, partial [Thermodesulfovibrionales bacterium]|nr:class I SAM-dependent methyltransferase [Thermodesulfovibrionales bacterium]
PTGTSVFCHREEDLNCDAGISSMISTDRDFSHVFNFTGYMKRIVNWFESRPPGMNILDMPAGAGRMRDALARFGHQVVCGDINREQDDYVFVDMNRPLPFPDNAFDAVLCLEGIEHVINPVSLIGEIVRITKKGGFIIISVPNITNLFSRLQFLLTGIFYQFNPALVPARLPEEMKDRGHISPLTYWQLRYLFEHFGASVDHIDGDRYKKKVLMPVYLPIILSGRLLSRKMLRVENNIRNRGIYSHMVSAPLLFSRSLIMYLVKG